MAIETKNASSGNSKFTPKGISVGNVKAAVRGIRLEKQLYAKDRDEYALILELETPPVGGNFVGFKKDWSDQHSPTYKGQSGRVKSSPFNMYDGKTPNGYDVSVQKDVLGFLRDLCQEAGCIEYFHAIDGKFATVEELVAAVNKAEPYKDVFIHWCIGGREYVNKKGYTAYDLNVVRAQNGLKPFSADENKVTKFDSAIHVRKAKPKELKDGFEATTTSATGATTKTGQNGNTQKATPSTYTSKGAGGMQPNLSFTEQVNADVKAQTSKVVEDDDSTLPFDLD